MENECAIVMIQVSLIGNQFLIFTFVSCTVIQASKLIQLISNLLICWPELISKFPPYAPLPQEKKNYYYDYRNFAY